VKVAVVGTGISGLVISYLPSEDHDIITIPFTPLPHWTQQKRWSEVSGVNNTYYAGAYWGYGFHEDGVNSALAVARQFGKGL
jgi:predicted NAD/FAD-binding protein